MSGSDPSTLRPTCSDAEKYFALSIEALRSDEIIDFDVYFQPQSTRPPVLYREKRLVMTQDALHRLRNANLRVVFVPRGQRAALRAYLASNLTVILADPTVPIDEKSSLLYLSAQETVREVLENPFVGEPLTRSQAVVDHTIDFLFHEEKAFSSLLRITSYDYYTYTHSVNVMVYAVSLARRVDMGDEVFYRRFGEATLLHDVGKSKIGPEITNAPGKLTRAQWDEMRRHPGYGKEILVELGVVDPLILDVVLHHHEKLNGCGYPNGLSGKDISAPVRISTIADIFDALTTRRSYKDALSTFGALRLMKEEFTGELDAELFRAFVEMMGAAN